MYRKKLIEVALPLEAINKASAREKSIRYGHPSTLHVWWARRPLAACRAVLFASLVDDPSSHPGLFETDAAQEKERERLFGIIERLVVWENLNVQTVLDEAKVEIAKSANGNPPIVYDPFCGGGSIPLEAQRLGLISRGSDLNPVAVLITKSLLELPLKFANRAPCNPTARQRGLGGGAYPGTRGLADDVRYYGEWLQAQAKNTIGHLYPEAKLANGSSATVLAWLWARTVACPNPACQAQMPLVRSFQLATKKGKEAWVEPEINHKAKTVSFHVRAGSGQAPTGSVNRKGARCLVCNTTVPFEHVRDEARLGRMSAQMMAIVCEGDRGRIYLDPEPDQELVANSANPAEMSETQLPDQALGFRVQAYGMTKHSDLFTKRQLVALMTFSDLVKRAREQAIKDGASDEYADAIATYLGLSASKAADNNSTICSWMSGIKYEVIRNTFSRQAVPMTWDYAEANPFAGSSGDFYAQVARAAQVIDELNVQVLPGLAEQRDAAQLPSGTFMFSTDPPYYDNIGYADLSDFFYGWIRRSLFDIYPELLSTILVPKSQELVATPFRFKGDRQAAREFFESGFGSVMDRIRQGQSKDYPFTIFYAFKQTEDDDESESDDSPNLASTGWETMLEGLMRSQFQITGTWPMRSERAARSVAIGTNALASSIVLVCRPRPEDATLTTRKDFLAALKRELRPAVRSLQLGNIAPVDLQQAAIGPGMSIFSRYKKVIESDGTAMRVRTALGLINQALDEVLSEQESDYDPETRWALAWFEQNQFNEGPFGDANTLANAKAVSVEGLQRAGILLSRAGRVRLLKREEFPIDWEPGISRHLTVWEVTQQLINRLATSGQEATRGLVGKVGGMADTARELAYRLYTLSERRGWAEEAAYYNALVIAWPAIRAQEFTLTGDK